MTTETRSSEAGTHPAGLLKREHVATAPARRIDGCDGNQIVAIVDNQIAAWERTGWNPLATAPVAHTIEQFAVEGDQILVTGDAALGPRIIVTPSTLIVEIADQLHCNDGGAFLAWVRRCPDWSTSPWAKVATSSRWPTGSYGRRHCWTRRRRREPSFSIANRGASVHATPVQRPAREAGRGRAAVVGAAIQSR